MYELKTVLEQIIKDGVKEQHITPELWKTPTFISSLIEQLSDSQVYQTFSILYYIYKQDIPKELVLKGLEKNGKILEYASIDIQNNRDIAMKAVLNNGNAIINTPYNNDIDFVQEIVLNQNEQYKTYIHLIGIDVFKTIGKTDPLIFFKARRLHDTLEQKLNQSFIPVKKNKI